MTDKTTTDELSGRLDQFLTVALPGQPPLMHMGTMYLVMDLWHALTVERERAEKAEAERDEAQHLLIRCVSEGTDGFAGDAVSLEFLRSVPAECAGVKRQRDEARRNLSIARSDGHHDGYRDGCIASQHNVDRIEREIIERCVAAFTGEPGRITPSWAVQIIRAVHKEAIADRATTAEPDDGSVDRVARAIDNRIERETIERCAKVADEWATAEQRQFGNGGPAAAIRAMREGD
jgi:hypothetical protein